MMILLIVNALTLGLLIFLGYTLLGLRFESKIYYIFAFLIFVQYFSILYIDGITELELFCIMILYCIYVFVSFKGDALSKSLVLFPFFFIVVLIDMVTVNILSIMHELQGYPYTNTPIYLIVVLILYAIAFTLCYIYINFLKYHKISKIPHYLWIVFVLPTTTMMLLLNLDNYQHLYKSDGMTLLAILGLLISNIIILYIFLKTINAIYYKSELEKIQLKEKYMNSKFELLHNQYDLNFNFLHDVLRTTVQLHILLEEKKYDELDIELHTLTDEIFKKFNTIYTNSIIVNTILNSKLNELRDYKINIKTTIEFNNFTFMILENQIDFFIALIDIGIQSCLLEENIRNLVLKTNINGTIIIIQLMFPHVESANKGEILRASYSQLHEIIEKYKGYTSIKENLCQKMDSMVIIFENR